MADLQASTYRRCDQVLMTRLSDGSGVLLDLESTFYFDLNATGLLVWERLGSAGASIAALTDALTREFEIDDAVARRDTTRLISALLAESLIEVAFDGGLGHCPDHL